MNTKSRKLGNGSITASVTPLPGGFLIKIIRLMLTKLGLIREVTQISKTASGFRVSREKHHAPFAGGIRGVAELLGGEHAADQAAKAAEAAEKMFRPGSRNELMEYLARHPDCSLGSIDVSALTNLSEVFLCSGRRDFSGIELWDTSKVTDMSNMFQLAVHFNQPIGIWDVSAVRSFSKMFMDTPVFNQPLEAWNTGAARSFYCMFARAAVFNQPLEGWDTSSAQNMRAMFYEAGRFNQPLNAWNVSGVSDFSSMFYKAGAFNQPLDRWDLASAENLNDMFCGAAAFSQDLSSWNLSRIKDKSRMFKGTPLESAAAGADGSSSNC